jgi:integrase
MEQVFKQHRLCTLHGPLGPYFDSYATEMCSEGYAQGTRETQIRLVADFGRWLARHRLGAQEVTEGILTIRGSKFGKSRLVPIHPSTCAVLADYASRRDRFLAQRPHTFFVSSRGTRLDGAKIRRTFYLLSRHIGLRGPSDSHGPRLHDFRQNAEPRKVPNRTPQSAGNC